MEELWVTCHWSFDGQPIRLDMARARAFTALEGVTRIWLKVDSGEDASADVLETPEEIAVLIAQAEEISADVGRERRPANPRTAH